jgi:hypothetical protein
MLMNLANSILRNDFIKLAALFLCVFCAACSHTMPLKVTGLETFAGSSDEGGQVIINPIVTTNPVLAVDAPHRRVTLKNSATGKARQSPAGPQVVNFGLIKPGDVVKATVVERTSIFFKPDTQTQTLKDSSLVVRGVAGGQPDAIGVNALDFTAKILDINDWTDEVTFVTGDGIPHTIPVGEYVNLADFNVGDEVGVRVTEAMAILMEKP